MDAVPPDAVAAERKMGVVEMADRYALQNPREPRTKG
jgi:hypothetical protein